MILTNPFASAALLVAMVALLVTLVVINVRDEKGI